MTTYTTGQIIDILKPGQKARCVEGDYQGKTITFHGRDFTWAPQDYVYLDIPLLECKWQFLPQYVTFEEALKAYKDGKIVRCEMENGDVQNYAQHFKGDSTFLFWTEITNGKWSICEEDSK